MLFVYCALSISKALYIFLAIRSILKIVPSPAMSMKYQSQLSCFERFNDCPTQMLVKEYRIPLPLTVEEYRIGET